MSHLEEYFGLECPHCQKMQKISAKVEIELGIPFERFEVWHNSKNMSQAEERDKEAKCGGVPFYFNTKTRKALCGEVTYEELLAWAKGE